MENDVKTSLDDKPVKVSNSLAGLPPIKQLFSDSWNTLTRSLLNLFLLTLVNIAANATVFLLFGLQFSLAISFPQKTKSFFGFSGQKR